MSDIDPTEISVVGRRIGQETFSQDLPDLPHVPPPSIRTEREGLPSGYRMRADAHYVEQLSMRRAERADPRPAVQVDAIEPSREPEAGDRRAERLLSQLQEEIASLDAAVGMISSEGSPLARRLGVDLIRAQAWRATWLLKAHALVDGRDRGQFRTRPIASLLEQLRQGLAPECRLAGISLKLQATDWNASVSVDERAFLTGIAGAVLATLGVLGQTEGATIRVHVDASSSDVRTIEVSQDEVPAPQAMALRLFETAWTDRPGGWLAGFGAQVARAAAELHGGGLSLVPGDRRGTTIRLSFVRSH